MKAVKAVLFFLARKDDGVMLKISLGNSPSLDLPDNSESIKFSLKFLRHFT